jgi:4-amino-4-deoxy-L-arabinose transferase-like glycosyltransferase
VRGPNAALTLLAFALVLLASAVTATYRLRHDAQIWTSDSAIYLRMTLEDRGLSREQAKAEADRFMAATPEGRNPEAKDFYTPHPPAYYASQYELFRTRPLYPRLGAVLYGRFGPRGLQLISAVAYVAAGGVTFWLLTMLVPAWTAALGALAFATAPQVLAVAALPLTDELALLFWTAALGAMLLYLRSPRPAVLAAVLVAALLLTFTRPAAYLPFGAACGLLVIALRTPRPGLRRTAYALLAATAAAGVAFAAYSLAVHGPGLVAQLRWQYEWQNVVGGFAAGGSFARWYLAAVAAEVGLLLTVGVYKYAALLPLVLAGVGLRLARRDDAALLAGAAAGALAAIAANPLELNRTVLLPLTPAVVILATVALDALFRAARGASRPPEAGDALAVSLERV